MVKKIMVFGTFDRLHPGHEFVITEALRRGAVTVIVARSKNVQKIKGRLPRETDDERIAAIRDKFPEAVVLAGDQTDFLAPVRTLRPDLILLGYDQRLPPNVTQQDLAPASIERLAAHEPERYKSSLR